MNAIDVCGLLGSAFIVVMFIPEINHVYKNRDAKAINYHFLHLNLAASVLSLVYSFHYNVVPMTITNVAASLFTFLMYYFKYIYEVKEKNLITDIVAEAQAPMV
tara:strand:+ start:326 stop:637 length:312 start_codon:yes stop_codon:yes gene_type:complete